MRTLRKSLVVLVLLVVLIVGAFWWLRPSPELPAGTVITRLVVHKAKREMDAFAGGSLVKTYRIALGSQPTGSKEQEGDGKTPEGIYFIESKNPYSGYHKNLGISYPTEKDRKQAAQRGVAAGGLIKIHGLRNGTGRLGGLHRLRDWTNGCIAITDAEVDELYRCVSVGTPIEILP